MTATTEGRTLEIFHEGKRKRSGKDGGGGEKEIEWTRVPGWRHKNSRKKGARHWVPCIIYFRRFCAPEGEETGDGKEQNRKKLDKVKTQVRKN